MFVVKRSGEQELVSFDKIAKRIGALTDGLSPLVDVAVVTQKVCAGVFSGVRTSDLDQLAADTAVALSSTHTDYGVLAARLAHSDLLKRTEAYARFSVLTEALAQRLRPEYVAFVAEHAALLDQQIRVADRIDACAHDFFGLKTLERSYLYKIDDAVAERPRCMRMRVACALNLDDVYGAIAAYWAMDNGWYTHATPTLFNAGSRLQTLASCFLGVVPDDLFGIFTKIRDCAMISKSSGGIGLSISNVRAQASWIHSTMGRSDGIVPLCRSLNATARWINQGGRRKGSFAVYLEPWHADVFAFLELRRNQGADEERARDLFQALWVPDEFMRRVQRDESWSLFSPDEAPGLTTAHTAEFEALYTGYEATPGLARRVLPARDLWRRIVEAQIETGMPYLLFKDQVNRASPQRHLGTIQCSNLCSEITIYSDLDETAVCNLASMALPRFVNDDDTFDELKFAGAVEEVVRNLNRVIDVSDYPTEEARRSNMRHRPIGVGVQGLANLFLRLRLPYDSPAARALNKQVFATLYYAALTASCELAKRHGPHASHEASPASEGVLHPDAYFAGERDPYEPEGLRADVKAHGVRNSLLVALMPTATTSQILGNAESFEPLTSLLYVRRTMAGEFVLVCRELVEDLSALGLWCAALKDKIVANGGSVQGLREVPADLQLLYRTAFEIPQKSLVEMAADRAPYVDQSCSQNVFMSEPTNAKLTSYHFYAWQKKLKTSSYYVRTKAAADPIAVTLTPRHCTEDVCVSCSA